MHTLFADMGSFCSSDLAASRLPATAAMCRSDRPKLLHNRRVRPPSAGGVGGGVMRDGVPVMANVPGGGAVVGRILSVTAGATSLPGANMSVHPDMLATLMSDETRGSKRFEGTRAGSACQLLEKNLCYF